MIISASRRTDIPAFYSTWLMNRIREGFVHVRNPFNYRRVSQISLSPQVVDCIVFWTKNPEPMLRLLPELAERGYAYYFQFTLTPYGSDVEPGVPEKSRLVEVFQGLSELIGKERVIWRYDPIILSDSMSIQYHGAKFQELAERLSGYTTQCVISFLDLYSKTRRNTKHLSLSDISPVDMEAIGQVMGKIAQDKGIRLVTCAEEVDLAPFGIEQGCCIDGQLIQSLLGTPLQVAKDKNQRPSCGCMASIDIGTYNTCLHRCTYCYANSSQTLVDKLAADHDPNLSMISGQLTDGDEVRQRKLVSLRSLQEDLFEKI